MTLQATNTYTPLFWMPGVFTATNITGTGLLLDAAGDKMGWVFIAPRTETIDVCAFRSTTITLGGNTTVQIEGIDLTNGRPDSSAVGSSTVLATTTATPGTYEVTGLNSSLTAGTPYALTLTYSTGTQTFLRDTGADAFKPFPYAYQFIDGASHAFTRTNDLQIALGRSVTDYIQIPGFVGPCTAAATSFTSAGTPDEPGMIFNLPFKARLAGVHIMCTQANDFTIKAYSSPLSSPSLLTSMTLTVDAQVQSANTHYGYRVYLFPAEIDLSINTDYAVTYVAGASSNLLTLTYTDADILKCVTGGLKGYGIGRVDGAGDFTAIGGAATTLPAIVPLFSKLDDGAGGSATIALPIGGRMAQV